MDVVKRQVYEFILLFRIRPGPQECTLIDRHKYHFGYAENICYECCTTNLCQACLHRCCDSTRCPECHLAFGERTSFREKTSPRKDVNPHYCSVCKKYYQQPIPGLYQMALVEAVELNLLSDNLPLDIARDIDRIHKPFTLGQEIIRYSILFFIMLAVKWTLYLRSKF